MRELIIAGQGGDRILFLGRTIAYSAFKENKDSSAFGSYGPETRGGVCNSQVKYSSEEEIYSPKVEKPDTMIITTQKSMDKFSNKLKEGILIYVPSRIKEKPDRNSIELIEVPALIENSRDKISNMFLLGAYLQVRKDISLETVVEKSLPEKMVGKPEKLLEFNIREIGRGIEYIKNNYPQYN